MKKTKKKLVASLVAIVLLLATAIGTTLALFTDTTDPITNSFTVGNVDIVLYESEDPIATAILTEDGLNDAKDDYDAYLAAKGVSILPTSVVKKNTYIANWGDVNAYVGMTISVPTSLIPYLDLAINTSAWTLNKTAPSGENTVYSYVYNNALAKENQTTALLSSITVKRTAGADFVTALSNLQDTDSVLNDFSVVVTGYAVQELGSNNAAAALNEGFSEVFNPANA